MPFSFINVMCSSFYRQKGMRFIGILFKKNNLTNMCNDYGFDYGPQLIATPASYAVVA